MLGSIYVRNHAPLVFLGLEFYSQIKFYLHRGMKFFLTVYQLKNIMAVSMSKVLFSKEYGWARTSIAWKESLSVYAHEWSSQLIQQTYFQILRKHHSNFPSSCTGLHSCESLKMFSAPQPHFFFLSLSHSNWGRMELQSSFN